MYREMRLAALLTLLLVMPEFAQTADGTDESRNQQMPMPMPQKKPGAPQPDSSQISGHEGMQVPGMNHAMQMNEAGMYLMNIPSITIMTPQSLPMPCSRR